MNLTLHLLKLSDVSFSPLVTGRQNVVLRDIHVYNSFNSIFRPQMNGFVERCAFKNVLDAPISVDRLKINVEKEKSNGISISAKNISLIVKDTLFHGTNGGIVIITDTLGSVLLSNVAMSSVTGNSMYITGCSTFNGSNICLHNSDPVILHGITQTVGMGHVSVVYDTHTLLYSMDLRKIPFIHISNYNSTTREGEITVHFDQISETRMKYFYMFHTGMSSMSDVLHMSFGTFASLFKYSGISEATIEDSAFLGPTQFGGSLLYVVRCSFAMFMLDVNIVYQSCDFSKATEIQGISFLPCTAFSFEPAKAAPPKLSYMYYGAEKGRLLIHSFALALPGLIVLIIIVAVVFVLVKKINVDFKYKKVNKDVSLDATPENEVELEDFEDPEVPVVAKKTQKNLKKKPIRKNAKKTALKNKTKEAEAVSIQIDSAPPSHISSSSSLTNLEEASTNKHQAPKKPVKKSPVSKAKQATPEQRKSAETKKKVVISASQAGDSLRAKPDSSKSKPDASKSKTDANKSKTDSTKTKSISKSSSLKQLPNSPEATLSTRGSATKLKSSSSLVDKGVVIKKVASKEKAPPASKATSKETTAKVAPKKTAPKKKAPAKAKPAAVKKQTKPKEQINEEEIHKKTKDEKEAPVPITTSASKDRLRSLIGDDSDLDILDMSADDTFLDDVETESGNDGFLDDISLSSDSL